MFYKDTQKDVLFRPEILLLHRQVLQYLILFKFVLMLTHFYVVNFPVGFKYKIYFILRNILLIPFLHIHPINIFELFFLSIFSHLIYREREKFLAVILPIVHFPKI